LDLFVFGLNLVIFFFSLLGFFNLFYFLIVMVFLV
jgi:hypothetical protein